MKADVPQAWPTPAAYPEAVSIAAVIGSPAWRTLAAGDTDHKTSVYAEIGRRLGVPDYQPDPNADAVAHWAHFDSWRPPSSPPKTFPDTRHRSGHYADKINPASLDRHERSAAWFTRRRDGGTTLLHHRHIQPILIREWSPTMAEYAGAIWASRTLSDLNKHKLPGGRTITRSISRV